MAINHILIAIDGTGSKEWRRADGLNSHIHRFYSDFTGPEKLYLDGPGNSGLDVGDIIDNSTREIYRMIGRLIRRNLVNNLSEIKINIIGHSRGGFIAIKTANFLQNPISFTRVASRGGQETDFFNSTMGQHIPPSLNVNFIGLYDAVKRTATETEGDLSLRNVEKTAHAQRQNMFLSRPTFQGMTIPNAATKSFDTSHGGIGGDPGFFTPSNKGKDIYCNALDLVNIERSWTETIASPLDSAYTLYWKSGASSKEQRASDVRRYWQSSINADNFIREQAAQKAIPLGGNSSHIPWSEKDQILGLALKSITNI